MSIAAIIDRVYELLAVIDQCDRNGRVNVHEWDAAGNPVGGSLSWDALGEINGAARELSEYGVPYEVARVGGYRE